MKQFDLKEYFANPERKVVTREGKEVEIINANGRGIFPIIGYIDDSQAPASWDSNGHFMPSGAHSYDLFFADEEPTVDLPTWHRDKAGTRLPGEAVIIYDIDHEPKLGRVMVNDGRYMFVKELEKLPEE